MPNPQQKDLNFSIVGLIITLIAVSLICFYQLFSDSIGRRISLNQFWQPFQITKELAQLKPQQLSSDKSDIYFIKQNQLYRSLANPEELFTLNNLEIISPIYTNQTKENIAFLTNDKKLHLVNLRSHYDSSYDLSNWSQAEIIHWDQDNQTIYLALKKDNWEITSLKLGELKPIVNNINFQSNKLTNTYQTISGYIVYPRCNPQCNFYLLNTTTLEEEKIIPAMTEGGADTRLTDLRLDFFQINSSADGLIAYEKAGSDFGKDFYVVNLKPDLLQAVQLQLNGQTQISYQGYLPKTKQIMFSSSGNPLGKQDVFLYTANRPSLEIANTFDIEKPIKIINSSGIYQYDGQLMFGKNILDNQKNNVQYLESR